MVHSYTCNPSTIGALAGTLLGLYHMLRHSNNMGQDSLQEAGSGMPLWKSHAKDE